MNKISYQIANYAVLQGYIIKEEIEEIRFGVEVILSQCITFLPILIYGFLTHQVIQTIFFLSIFCTLRVLSNGFHCKKFLNCFLLTNGIFFMTIEFCGFLNMFGYFKLLIPIITMIMMKIYYDKKVITQKDRSFIVLLTTICFLSFMLVYSTLLNELLMTLLILNIVTFQIKE